MTTKLKTKLEQELHPFAIDVVKGRLLSFDPSSGSAGSLPGWALYSQGELVEAGLLNIPRSGPIHIRLQALMKAVSELPKPDVVAVEQISHFIKGFNKGAVNLHKAIGVIQAACQCPKLVNVAVISWKKLVPESYLKDDDRDAIGIGYKAVQQAFILEGLEPPPPPWEDKTWTKNFSET